MANRTFLPHLTARNATITSSYYPLNSIISSRISMSSFVAAAPYRHAVVPFDAAQDAQTHGNSALAKLIDDIPNLKIYTRSSPRYEALRGVYNKLITAKPLALCRPTSIAQIQAIVKAVSGLNVPLGVRAGGHDVFGRGCIADSITIDMRELDTQELAEDKKTVTVGGGITSKNLVGFLGSHNLCTSNGFAGEAGWTSWAAWGGYGPLGDYVGLGVDNIVGAKIVTANGDLVHANQGSELLWALRGGGGNFGVIVETDVRVYPMSTIQAGFIVYPWPETADVLLRLQALLDAGTPDKLCLQAGFSKGEWGLGMAVTYIWPEAETIGPESEKWLQKLKNLGTCIVDTVQETTFQAFQSSISSAISNPVNVTSRHISISKFTSATLKQLIDACEAMPAEADCSITCTITHGKAAQPNALSAFGTRRPHIMFHINAVTDEAAHEDVAVAWADRLVDGVEATGDSIGPTYVSFMESEKDPKVCYGDSWDRLKAVKRSMDQDDVFRFVHGRISAD
ncbi:6-hydroxy-d-nicotine oxidase [Fusarium longipes]|uniref:6-hydroxy-d-nicotine oxidase n=1 Tax=Fusarium longipes TaxID=694270 RepID=A0A395RWC7_9HYPO|nr:6-hydroxy-d-nicotine oxidase [Fusarium longipes]